VDGLYYADSMGEVLQTEINARLWWDFHNGRGNEPLNPTLYAWRAYEDDGMVYAPIPRLPAVTPLTIARN